MRLRLLILLFIASGSAGLCAQSTKNNTSSAFSIEGEVSSPVTLTPDSLLTRSRTLTSVDSLVIYSHDMKPKHTIHNLKGVLLKEILPSVKLNADNPKDLSSFYFICEATDGYKVVFSWNELFNTETGNHAMVIVSEDGRSGNQLEDRIALISPTDKATGRRYVKWLKTITVARVK